MAKSLKNILIPLDFSKINTIPVLEKVIALIEPHDSVIHLLHLVKSSSDDKIAQENKEAEKKLCSLKQALLKILPSVSVSLDKTSGRNVQKLIVQKANQLNADIIVIIKERKQKLFSFGNSMNATLIAKETNAAVLIVNAESIPNKIRSIVLPVRSFVPEKNIELLSALTGKNKPIIHLVTAPDKDKSNNKTNIFINTYRTLSDLLHYPVEYKVLTAKNFSKIVLGYGKNIMADLVFVNPFDELKGNSGYSTDFGDMISPDSKQCILIVKSFQMN
jgi:Universal stress protein family